MKNRAGDDGCAKRSVEVKLVRVQIVRRQESLTEKVKEEGMMCHGNLDRIRQEDEKTDGWTGWKNRY